jgi:hypothetical protein
MTDVGDGLEIRIANTDDMDAIMAQAVMASEEAGVVNVDMSSVVREIWSALNQDHGLCAVIGKPNGPIEGFVLLRIGKMWYSDTSVLEEKVIFIHPDYRKAPGGRAAKFCDFSKKVADRLGLPLLIGVSSTHRTAAKIRLYERHFGKQSGAFFLYNGNAGTAEVTEH